MQWWMRPGPSLAWAHRETGAFGAEQVARWDANLVEAQLDVAFPWVEAEHIQVADDADPWRVHRD
jgi:hypothetical protein